MAAAKEVSSRVSFQTVNSLVDVPSIDYDLVSMVDVVHHVPAADQLSFVVEAASKLRSGGTLIYKDISAGPSLWRFCNTLHDFVVAREVVHYLSEESLVKAMAKVGLECQTISSIRKLWYMHVIYIFVKSSEPQSAWRS